jgi:lipopolysaccharide biosynthesis glycosyltransferase
VFLFYSNPSNCAYNYSSSEVALHALFHSAQDKPQTLNYFNSGLIVLKPSKKILDAMLTALHNLSELTKYKFPDQDFLNEKFSGKWIPLSYKYNALKTYRSRHPSMWVDEEIKIAHYIYILKPWNYLNWTDMSEEEQRRDGYYVVNSWWFEAYGKMVAGY